MNNTTDTTHTDALVGDYLAAWNETDPQRRRELIARTFTDRAAYLDPLMSAEGHDGINSMIAGVQEEYAGHVFVAVGKPDAHHDRIRFAWHLVHQDGDAIALGIDFAELADDGRLRCVTGFLERVSS